MHELQAIFAILLVAVAIVGNIAWHFGRSRQVLEDWARTAGYEIVHSEYRTFFRGPFFFTTSKGQTVYYVRVRDAKGKERAAWVRCGSWLFGLWTGEVDVQWDDAYGR